MSILYYFGNREIFTSNRIRLLKNFVHIIESFVKIRAVIKRIVYIRKYVRKLFSKIFFHSEIPITEFFHRSVSINHRDTLTNGYEIW